MPQRKGRYSADQLASEIYQLINKGEYQPGDRLKEQELADRFQVSRGPVREALRSLEAKAMVRLERGRGATVTRLTDQEALETIEISSVLFGLAAFKASQAGAADIPLLRAKCRELDAMVAMNVSARAFFEHTLSIGTSVCEASKSDRLFRMIVDVRLGAATYFGHLGFISENMRAIACHKWHDLVDAIETGEAHLAERLGREVHEDVVRAALKIFR